MAASLAASLASQAPPTALLPAPAVHGIAATDGGFHAAGPDYKADLYANGIAFTPALGRSVATNQPLLLEPVRLARTSGPEVALQPVPPQRSGHRLRWHRPGLVERVDVSAAGLEHSYLLERPIPGQGDLVLTHRVHTDLQPAPMDGGGMRFRAFGPDGAEVGGVQVGGVTGIDARGHRVQGSLAFQDGSLAYRLPADFVDAAAWPVVIDPFLTPYTLAATAFDDVEVDLVGGGNGSGQVAIVYERQFSGADTEIRATVVDGNTGAALSPLLVITSNVLEDFDPRVALVEVGLDFAFVVTWTQAVSLSPLDTDVMARAFDVSGVGGPAITLSGGLGLQSHPDIASLCGTNRDEAVIVYGDSVGQDVRAGRVRCDAALGLTRLASAAPIAVSGLYNDDQPAIANAPGSLGADRLCIVWRRASTFTGVQIRGAICNGALQLLDPLIAVTTATLDVGDPAVDGAGNDWIVAWEQEEFAGSAATNIACRAVRWLASGQGAVRGVERTVGGIALRDERNPAVASNGQEALIVWERDVAPVGTELVAEAVSVFDGTAVDAIGPVLGAPDRFVSPALSQTFGTGNSIRSRLLLGFSREGGPGATQDPGWLTYEAFSGTSTLLAGNCGGGGRLAVVGNASPNFSFRMGLVDGVPLAPSFAILSFQQINAGCNGCSLLPDPYTGAVVPLTLDADGDGGVAIPIPAGVAGLKFYGQFATVHPAGLCSAAFTKTDFSDGRLVRIR